MAKDPIATGLQIGQGEAQVFDTSGLVDFSIELQEKRKAEKEKKEKALLDSIIDLDTSNVWSRDMGMYNDKWGAYRDYVKENHRALQNPAKNMDVWAEKKRLEQELLNFVASSKQAHERYISMEKYEMDNETKINTLKDETGKSLLEGWKERAGDFNFDYKDAFEYLPDIKGVVNRATVAATKASTRSLKKERYDDKGNFIGYTQEDTLDKEAWDAAILDVFSNPRDKKEIEAAYEYALREGSTEATTPQEFLLENIEEPALDYAETRTTTSTNNWSFGSGGGGTYGKYTFSKDRSLYNDVKTDRLAISGPNSTKPFIMDLGGDVKEDGFTAGELQNQKSISVTFKDIIRENGEYRLRLNYKKLSIDEYKKRKEELELSNLSSEELKEEMRKLDKLKASANKEYGVLDVPLDSETNIANIETHLGINNLYEQLPQLFGDSEENIDSTNNDPLNLGL